MCIRDREEIAELPTGFADGDILDPKIADLNTVNLKDRFKTGAHLIICIGPVSYTHLDVYKRQAV